MNREQIEALVKGMVDFEKTIKKALAANPDIKDLYEDMHGSDMASGEDTGPREEASGKGAQTMVEQYSDTDAQQGLMQQYESLASHFSGELASMKSSLDAILTRLSKSDEETLEEAEIGLEKALRTLGRAEASDDEKQISKAKEGVDNAKTRVAYHRAQAAGNMTDDLRSRFEALPAVEKSSIEDRLESLTTRVDELSAKVVKANDAHDAGGRFAEKDGESDKNDDDEDDKKKKDEKETKKSEDHVSETEDKEELKKMVKSLRGQVADLQERSRDAGVSEPPALFKSKDRVELVKGNVQTALESGDLPSNVEDEANRLLQQMTHVQGGRLPENIFTRSLESALPQTRELFEVKESDAN